LPRSALSDICIAMRHGFYGMLATVALALAGGLAFMYSGIYNVAATSGHSAFVYWMLEQGMRASVRRRAGDVVAPRPFDEAMLSKGAHCFDVNCAQCHGAPGKAPAGFGKGVLPSAKSLTQTARDWSVEHIYWITRNGIRMTAMPAWEFRLDDRDLWAIAAFVDGELPQLTVEQYRARVAAASDQRCERPTRRAPPDSQRGLVTMRQYGCHGCHIIPGIPGPEVHVGPSLEHFAKRPLIAGALPNTPDTLLGWLLDPQSHRPHTQMPNLALTEQHAQDIRAYLATLE
jgi:mono/diheme cytochrome c family protein